MNKLAIKWQNFAQVELQFKFDFRIRIFFLMLSITIRAHEFLVSKLGALLKFEPAIIGVLFSYENNRLIKSQSTR